MAILNFPSNPQTNDQYTGDNGTTYIFDGVKWVGIGDGVLNIGSFEFTDNTITTTDSSNIVIGQTVNITSDLVVDGNLTATIDGGNASSIL